MGILGMRGGREPDEPTLEEAWGELASRVGLSLDEAGRDEVHAHGVVRGRRVRIDITGRRRGSELLQSFARTTRRRAHQVWRTELAVGVENPRGVIGTIRSFVDTEDPDWDPRDFDRSHCRVVRADSAELEDLAVSDSVRERLGGLIGDHVVTIDRNEVRLSDERRADADGGYFVGVPIHVEYPGAPLPWPERALAGPPWWIELLLDIADDVDDPASAG